jgi:hypothetical protein
MSKSRRRLDKVDLAARFLIFWIIFVVLLGFLAFLQAPGWLKTIGEFPFGTADRLWSYWTRGSFLLQHDDTLFLLNSVFWSAFVTVVVARPILTPAREALWVARVQALIFGLGLLASAVGKYLKTHGWD